MQYPQVIIMLNLLFCFFGLILFLIIRSERRASILDDRPGYVVPTDYATLESQGIFLLSIACLGAILVFASIAAFFHFEEIDIIGYLSWLWEQI